MRRWVGLGRIRGTSRTATVTWEVIIILEEKEEINRNLCEVLGSACCAGALF